MIWVDEAWTDDHKVVKGAHATPSAFAGWSPTWVAVVALAALVLVVFYDTVASMVAIWMRSETFAHGFAIVPISIYLLWRRRHTLGRIKPCGSLWGLIALFMLSGTWFLADIANVLVVKQLTVVAMLPAVLWALAGSAAVRVAGFPLAYLVFAVPMGEGLLMPLMEFTADFTVGALRVIGIPIYREGLFFSIPSGDFEVAEACSGLRYLIASLALGTLFAYLNYRTWWRRALFIGTAIVVPILANGLRAVGIVLLAHASEMRLAVDVDHLIYGWLFFGIVMLLLFWIGRRFAEPAVPPVGGPTPGRRGAADGAFATGSPLPPGADAPVGGPTPGRRGAADGVFATGSPLPPGADVPVGGPTPGRRDAAEGSWRGATAAAVAALMLLSGPALAWWLKDAATGDAQPPRLMQARGEWQGPGGLGEPTWHPLFVGADVELAGSYRRGSATVDLFIAHYARQRQGAELVNSENRVYDGVQWVRSAEWRERLALNDDVELDVNVTSLRSGGRQRLVLHWYEVGGIATARDTMAKFLQVRTVLRSDAAGAAAVAVATDFTGQAKEARAIVMRFLDAHYGVLRSCLTGHPRQQNLCAGGG